MKNLRHYYFALTLLMSLPGTSAVAQISSTSAGFASGFVTVTLPNGRLYTYPETWSPIISYDAASGVVTIRSPTNSSFRSELAADGTSSASSGGFADIGNGLGPCKFSAPPDICIPLPPGEGPTTSGSSTEVPEPQFLGLFALGLAGLFIARRRSRVSAE